jgi:hypothetical protein
MTRVETDVAEETLGILIAPDGNRKQQVEKMIQQGLDWVKKKEAGILSTTEIWISWQSTL